VEKRRYGMLKDGDYNPGQLRPVVEGRWMERQKTRRVLQQETCWRKE
jgi:hypothetical protein